MNQAILLCLILLHVKFNCCQYLINNGTENSGDAEVSDNSGIVKEVHVYNHTAHGSNFPETTPTSNLSANGSRISTPQHSASPTNGSLSEKKIVLPNKIGDAVSIKNKVYLTKMSYRNSTLGKLEDYLSLDPEWNYNTSTLNTTKEIPYRIIALYHARNISVAKDKLHNVGCVSRILFNNKSGDPHVVRFNMDSLNENERVLDAELLYYFSPDQLKAFAHRQAVLRVYQLLSSEETKIKNVTYLRNTIDTHRLLNVVYVSYTKSAWQVFKIRKAIDNWVANERSNHGIVLTLSSFNEKGYIHNIILNDTNENELRTFLIVTTGKKNGERINKLNSQMILEDSSCKKSEYYIDFTRIGHLNKVIIEPKGYMAYDCEGSCSSSPLTNHMKMLKTYQNFTRTARESYCVPTRYLSLPIMFYDKYENIVLKVYNNMAVEQCGCR